MIWRFFITKTSRREGLFVLLLLAVMLSAAYYDIVFLGKTFKLTTVNPQALDNGVYGQENNRLRYYPLQSTDAVTVEEPVYEFIRQSLRQGILPMWNPHQACGYPLIGMMQVGLFWPLHILLYLLPNPISWDVMLLCRSLLAGVLCYGFMRSLRYAVIPSLTAAIVYMLSGPMVLSQWAFVNVEVLTPLLLLTLNRLLERPDGRSVVFAAFAEALLFLAGHAEHIFLVNVYGCIFFVYRLFTLKPRPPLLKSAGRLIFSWTLGGTLAAVVLFPFFANWHSEFWHAHPEHLGLLAEGWDLVKETLVCFLAPTFYQEGPVSLDYSRFTFWGHVGMVPMILAGVSLLSRQRRYLNGFFAIAAFLIFVKSHLPSPIDWIGYLPIFNICRFYHHTQHLFAFSLAVLAGMGMRALPVKNAWQGGVFYSLLFLGFLSWVLFESRAAEYFSQSLHSFSWAAGFALAFLALIFVAHVSLVKKQKLQALVLIVLFVELVMAVPRERVRRFESFPQVPYVNVIKSLPKRARSFGVLWALFPNTASGYQLDDFGVIEGFMFKRYVQFINQFIIKDYFKKNYGSSSFRIAPVTFLGEQRRFLDMLNVEVSVAPPRLNQLFPAARALDNPQLFYNREVRLLKSLNALPRAHIVHRVIFEEKEEDLVQIMREIAGHFSVFAVLQHAPEPSIIAALEKAPLKDDSNADIISYSPNEVMLRANMKSPGFLIFADTFHPDWKAYVDSKETKVYFANYLVRAIFLPEGQHQVRFSFQPRSFFFGLWLSIFSLVCCLIFLWKFYRRPKDSQH